MKQIPNLHNLPPVWMVAAMIVMAWLARAVPIIAWESGLSQILGWLVIAVAIALAGWAALQFRRQNTSIIPHREPDALIISGPYRFSRNPIYLADVLILTGWTLVLGALSPLIMIAAFIFVINRRFIIPEENALKAKFSNDFDQYARTTGRWI